MDVDAKGLPLLVVGEALLPAAEGGGEGTLTAAVLIRLEDRRLKPLPPLISLSLALPFELGRALLRGALNELGDCLVGDVEVVRDRLDAFAGSSATQDLGLHLGRDLLGGSHTKIVLSQGRRNVSCALVFGYCALRLPAAFQITGIAAWSRP